MVRAPRVLACLAAGLLAALPAFAELKTTAEITTVTGAVWIPDAFQLTASVEGRLTFQAEASRDVKGLVELDSTITPGCLPAIVFDVPRAYIKTRFPFFRLTVGKTRLSWGSGFIFDAGDVIFGGMSASLDLTQADPRDQTAWLASVYVPLGDFSFLEAVMLPFMPQPPGVPVGTGSPIVPFESLNAGGRALVGLPGITLEAGYLYNGSQTSHMPYVSVQTSLYVDLYAAAGITIPQDAAWDDLKDSFRVSFGMSRIFNLEALGNLSFRAEAGFLPYGDWEEATGGLLPGTSYGATVYAELSYAPSDAFSVSARSVFSPIDFSGLAFLGVTWGAFQGFTLGVEGLVMFGDSDDLFGWDRDGDIAFLVVLRYRF